MQAHYSAEDVSLLFAMTSSYINLSEKKHQASTLQNTALADHSALFGVKTPKTPHCCSFRLPAVLELSGRGEQFAHLC